MSRAQCTFEDITGGGQVSRPAIIGVRNGGTEFVPMAGFC